MNQTPQYEICPICNKTMTPFAPKVNLKASEWYCSDCRKSIRMEKPGEANYWMGVAV